MRIRIAISLGDITLPCEQTVTHESKHAVREIKSAVTIQWISVDNYKQDPNSVIHRIVIHPVESVIHRLNNWDQKNRYSVDKCCQNKQRHPQDSDLSGGKHCTPF